MCVGNKLTSFFFSLADIVFIVKDKPHPIFKRDDDDLIYTATVPLGKVSLMIHHYNILEWFTM